MRNIVFIFPVLLFVGFIGISLKGLMRGDDNALPSTIIGHTAPVVMIDEFTGNDAFSHKNLRGADVTVLNFWASWCAPCRAEHAHLKTLFDAGLPVYGVNYRDNPENAAKFLDELGNPFTALGSDRAGRTAVEWGVYGLPETFFIAADGTVLYRLAGPLTRRTWENRVRPAMAEYGIQLPPL